MKRLYIKPEARGCHLRNILVSEIIKRVQNNGFKEMVLDTIVPLKPISLYKKHDLKNMNYITIIQWMMSFIWKKIIII